MSCRPITPLPVDPEPITIFRAFMTDEAARARMDRAGEMLARSVGRPPLTPGEALEALGELADLPRWWLRALGVALRAAPDEVAIAAVVDALGRLSTVPPVSRAAVVEMLVEDLRWRGTAGAEALAGALPALIPSAQARAALALGLTGHRPAIGLLAALADRLWRRTRTQRHALGPVMALCDLDGAGLEVTRRIFDAEPRWWELYALLGRWGDAEDVPRLLGRLGGEPIAHACALAGLNRLARRLGVPAFLAALPDPDMGPGFLDWLSDTPTELFEQWFTVEYIGLALGGPRGLWRPVRGEAYYERAIIAACVEVRLW